MFRRLNPGPFFIVVHVVRTVLIIAALVVLLTTEGKEVQYGFWLVTNIVIFTVQALCKVVIIVFVRLRKNKD